MNEGYTEKFIRSVKARIMLSVFASGLAVVVATYILVELFGVPLMVVSAIMITVWAVVSLALTIFLGGALTKPLKYLADAILHVSPKETLVAAPNFDDLTLGREMVASLARQVYDFNVHGAGDNKEASTIAPNLSFDLIPIPVLGLDAESKIVAVNSSSTKVFQGNAGLVGSKLDQAMSLEFEADETIDKWLQAVKEQSVNASKTWTNVKVTSAGTGESTYFDVAVSLSQKNASGIEAMLVFFDHSDAYTTEQDAMSFVALAVHELRTPLTILRGYIEAIEDELGPNIDSETRAFIYKMNISAETLSGFVSKILSVARVEENQLALHLAEDDWMATLKTVLSGLQMRAKANDKVIALEVGENIPHVAVDKIAISEVITNLVDNAIKYSPDSAQNITVKSFVNQEGMIETTVHDTGVGIPSSVMPHLFTKFYRNHRNASLIGGTGLGLYLSKAIITAHRGNIWARSKDGEGSTFGFTILPYDRLAEADKTDNNDITRQRHGWIKNHTMERR